MTTDTSSLVDPQLVVLDLAATDRRAAIEALADRLVAAGRVTDRALGSGPGTASCARPARPRPARGRV